MDTYDFVSILRCLPRLSLTDNLLHHTTISRDISDTAPRQHLDVELEGGVRRDGRWRALFAICILRSQREYGLLALSHRLYALVPSFDHLPYIDHPTPKTHTILSHSPMHVIAQKRLIAGVPLSERIASVSSYEQMSYRTMSYFYVCQSVDLHCKMRNNSQNLGLICSGLGTKWWVPICSFLLCIFWRVFSNKTKRGGHVNTSSQFESERLSLTARVKHGAVRERPRIMNCNNKTMLINLLRSKSITKQHKISSGGSTGL